MIAFNNEQFLPCELPEIVSVHERKELSDPDAPLYLQDDLFAYPMNTGYVIGNARNRFLVDSLDLLQSIPGKSARETCHSDEDLAEAEQYFHNGLVGYEKKSGKKLTVTKIRRKFIRLYEKSDTTSFCHIPLRIELDITKKCNFRCRHCAKADTPTGPGLSLQEYVDVIRQAAKLGVPEFTFMGGEPTCNPSFIELATLARLSGVRTLSTSTNGWLVDEKLAEKMAVLFDSIQVSIHGADPKTHDSIVGRPGAFSRACRAVKLFRKYHVPMLNISCTVMHENADQLEAMVCLARDLQAPSIRFLTLYAQGRGRHLDQWNMKEKTELAEKVRKVREKNHGDLTINGGGLPPYYSINNDAATYGCTAGRTLLYICADGDVRACGNLDQSLGNIRDEPIMDLWHSRAMIALRNKPSCDCPYTNMCAGGCLDNPYWREMFQADSIPVKNTP